MPATSPAFSRALAFGDDPDTYNALRPPVPRKIVRWMVPEPCHLAVEIGAGTGLFTRDLATYAVNVDAIDKDKRMRTFLARNRPANVRVLSGDAGAMPDVRERSAALVTVSSAWHWFDVSKAALEIARVLKDDGWLSVVWTHRDTDVAWMREICDLTDRPHEHTPGEFVLPRQAPFGAIDHKELKWPRGMPTMSVVALMGTYSGMLELQKNNPDEAARVRGQISEILRSVESDGLVDVPFRTLAFRTQRTPRPAGGWAGGHRHTPRQLP